MPSFDGLFASRSNYDVAQGVDDEGVWRSGVLEQSWRIGGASGAEIAALQMFRDQPRLRWVQASTHEIHGEPRRRCPAARRCTTTASMRRPAGSLKYATVDAHGDA